MEDPPSISEGCGGRVTDYRINVSVERTDNTSFCSKPCACIHTTSNQLFAGVMVPW